MNCPKCGKEMIMTVMIGLILPSHHSSRICKKVIRLAECKITHADWDKAKVHCYDCHYREVGL